MTLEEVKHDKAMQLDLAEITYINKPITIGTQLFPAGTEELTLYKQALELGRDLNMTEGNLPTMEGVQIVTEEALVLLIKEMSIQIAKGKIKRAYYRTSLHLASTVEEAEAIVWEEAYTGGVE